MCVPMVLRGAGVCLDLKVTSSTDIEVESAELSSLEKVIGNAEESGNRCRLAEVPVQDALLDSKKEKDKYYSGHGGCVGRKT